MQLSTTRDQFQEDVSRLTLVSKFQRYESTFVNEESLDGRGADTIPTRSLAPIRLGDCQGGHLVMSGVRRHGELRGASTDFRVRSAFWCWQAYVGHVWSDLVPAELPSVVSAFVSSPVLVFINPERLPQWWLHLCPGRAFRL